MREKQQGTPCDRRQLSQEDPQNFTWAVCPFCIILYPVRGQNTDNLARIKGPKDARVNPKTSMRFVTFQFGRWLKNQSFAICTTPSGYSFGSGCLPPAACRVHNTPQRKYMSAGNEFCSIFRTSLGDSGGGSNANRAGRSAAPNESRYLYVPCGTSPISAR